MIERLIVALQALAAPVEVQLQRFPNFVAQSDELALDFADAFVLVSDCPQLEGLNAPLGPVPPSDATYIQ